MSLDKKKDKNHQKFAKAILIHVSKECFLTFFFWINFLFLKILEFLTQKNWHFGQKEIFFGGVWSKFSKIRN